MMDKIGRVFFEKADLTGYYVLNCTPDLGIALLPGAGVCYARQAGNGYTLPMSMTPPDADAVLPVLSIAQTIPAGSLGDIDIVSKSGGFAFWLSANPDDTPPTITVNGVPMPPAPAPVLIAKP